MTPNINLDAIRGIAMNFRRAIGACERSSLPITFEEFPLGSCGDAALLLGTYLIEKGFEPFEYVLGRRGEHGGTHAWLTRDQVEVDITADQFADAPGPIIVEVNSPWHQSFRQEVENVADFRIYDEHTVTSLASAYRLILERLAMNDRDGEEAR